MSPALPPEALVLLTILGKMSSRCLYVAAKLGVADQLKDGPLTAAELAKKLDVNEDGLNRTLRTLAAIGIFSETAPRTYALNPAAQLLRTDVPGSLNNGVQWLGDDTSWRAFEELEYSVRTGLPAYDKVHGKNLFEYLSGNPQVGAIFNNAMSSLSANFVPAILGAYDFSSYKTLVDVGGGHGAMLSAILERHPESRGVLFDLPQVVKHAPQRERMEVVPGSFFEQVPAGADAYILKYILHDWDDAHSLTILRNIRKAMSPNGRVLVMESLITPGPESTISKLSDLEMLVITPSGRERTQEEYAALFEQAGLKLARIVPTGAPMLVIEAQPA